MTNHEPLHDPLQPHSHEPNPAPPSPDSAFEISLPGGREMRYSATMLRALPQTVLPDCYIVSTGHGTSGPFAFGGPTLLVLVQDAVGTESGAAAWSQVEVISADGFGTRVQRAELEQPDGAGAIVAAVAVDGRPLTREEGLVRLIVPSERDDALRQVKWIGRINVR